MKSEPTDNQREIGSSSGGTAAVKVEPSRKRTVCDHCRRRRIRCDGHFPCQQCANASLACRREHVPRKRGPKRGHGRVINELRARDGQTEGGSRESSVEHDAGTDDGLRSATNSVPSTPPDISWNKVAADPRNAPEPRSIFTSDQYHPISRSYFPFIPQCVELYYEHIYPIMPLLYMPTIRETVRRPLEPFEKNLVFALCALTCFHMSGKSIKASGPDSWEAAGRFFLDECLVVRQSYDFLEDTSLYAVISSFWLSTSFFEINQSRKSWLYLREALTLALDMGLQDDSTYVGLGPAEKLCRQRVFWQLFVTERSFAVLRNKPISFKKTPSLPTTRHPYELPEIHSGFRQLILSYVPLDESFVSAWNDGSDPRINATTYLSLQKKLAAPPSFLSRSSPSSPFSESSPALPTAPASPIMPPGYIVPFGTLQGHTGTRDPNNTASTATDEEEPETTAIQKADLLITQQWLRLIVWRSSFQQGLLSWSTPHESMHFAFPLSIARRTVSVLQALPSTAVEVHGMGIFEKIFEVGTWCINVLGAYDSAISSGTYIGGAGTPAGLDMDFVGGEVGVLGLGRKSAVIDPLEFFVRTLSASPNSRTQFAERLLMFANQRPGGMKMALSPSLGPPGLGPVVPQASWSATGSVLRGSVLGEVKDETNLDERQQRLVNSTSFESGSYDIPLVSPSTSSFAEGIADGTETPLMSPDLASPLFGWDGNPFAQSTVDYGDELLVSPEAPTSYSLSDIPGTDYSPQV